MISRRFPRSFHIVGAVICSALLAASTSAARAQSVLQSSSEGDWAQGWLKSLFRGAALPSGFSDSAAAFAPLAATLREALSFYSLGMLVLAGLIVAYHVVVIVVETAHHGVPLGRRVNQFWAPIRFVLAIGLLVPVGGGLNSGQYIIVKLADAGSSLASNAWSAAIDTMKGSLSGFVAPLGPDVARLTAVATEIELCRSLYNQIHASLLPDPALARAGTISDVQKIPQGRLAPETWRASNALHASLPLCGEYRFAARSQEPVGALGDDETGKFPNELADFARADAERLMMQTRALTERIASSFVSGTTPAADIGTALSVLMQEQQKAIDGKLRAITAGNASSIERILAESAASGWTAAGFFVGYLARRQTNFGSLATYAIPSAQSPLFGHKALSASVIAEAVDGDAVLRRLPAAQLERVYAAYAHVSAAMKRARAWLYGSQILNADFILADSMDVQDQVGPGSDSGAGFFLLTRVLNSGMATYGVWSGVSHGAAANGTASAFARDMAKNPVAGVAEAGRRFAALGTHVMGLAGPVLSEPGALGSALLFVVTGAVFGAAGFALLFFVPLFPLFRFFMGILVWLLAVLEAVVSLPLVAIAHLSPVGEGLSGPVARQAYWLWLGVFMRPLLTLFGFVAGFGLFILALALLNGLYAPLMNSFYSAHSDVFVTVRAGLSLCYVLFVLAAANLSFKGISWLPDRVLQWLGRGAEAVMPEMPVAARGGTLSVSGGPAAAVFAEGPSGTASYGAVAGSKAADRMHEDGAAASARAQSLKASLIPAYREPSSEPVIIPTQGGVAEAASAEGATGSGAAVAASASAGKATAHASATAHAVAMSRQIPLPDKPTPKDIEKALDQLKKKDDKKLPAPEAEDKDSLKAQESREQEAARIEDQEKE